MKYPHRKQNRLQQFDYSISNAYFITICTDNRKKLFWIDPESKADFPQNIILSKFGLFVDDAIKNISHFYPAISVDHYVIMPDHLHLLLRINSDDHRRPLVAPTVLTVVQQMKGVVSKHAGFPIWQKGFYDHVIRGEQDYREIWEYIESNPGRWYEKHNHT